MRWIGMIRYASNRPSGSSTFNYSSTINQYPSLGWRGVPRESPTNLGLERAEARRFLANARERIDRERVVAAVLAVHLEERRLRSIRPPRNSRRLSLDARDRTSGAGVAVMVSYETSKGRSEYRRRRRARGGALRHADDDLLAQPVAQLAIQRQDQLDVREDIDQIGSTHDRLGA